MELSGGVKVAVFSTKPYDREFLPVAATQHELIFYENRLRTSTASLALGCDAVCAFVNDDLSADCLRELKSAGVELIALRCAGYNNVDVETANKLGITVLRVPEYSPYAVAEHTLALLLALNRHIHKAYTRVRDGNFALNGLMGFDLHGKTIGVIGTGKIGAVFCRLLSGFGMRIMAFDPSPRPELVDAGVEYGTLDEIYSAVDILSLHCPLTPQTHHMLNAESLLKCRDGLFLVNTSRGGLIDTAAVIQYLKCGKIGGLALDVYEEESGLFFENLSDKIVDDDTLMRLTTFPNVILTSHQAFFTREALEKIASVTAENLDGYSSGHEPSANKVS